MEISERELRVRVYWNAPARMMVTAWEVNPAISVRFYSAGFVQIQAAQTLCQNAMKWAVGNGGTTDWCFAR